MFKHHTPLWLLVFLILISACTQTTSTAPSPPLGQTSPSLDYPQDVEGVVNAFYRAWLDHPGNPLADEIYKTSPHLSPVAVQRLEAGKTPSGWMADPVLCAQDRPSDFEIETVQEDGGTATALVVTGFGNRIGIDLVRQEGQWQIDSIACLRD